MNNTHDNKCPTWHHPNWPCNCSASFHQDGCDAGRNPNRPCSCEQEATPTPLIPAQAVITVLSILALIFIVPGFFILAFFPAVFIGGIIYVLVVMYKEDKSTGSDSS